MIRQPLLCVISSFLAVGLAPRVATAQCDPPGPCCPPPPVSLVVTSPVGGGYPPGTVLPVAWSGENIISASYYVSYDGGAYSGPGSTWTITVPCPEHTISVLVSASATCGRTLNAYSGAVTANYQLAITLTGPAAGSEFPRGSPVPITWSTTGPVAATTSLTVYRNGVTWDNFTRPTADGAYTWTMPQCYYETNWTVKAQVNSIDNCRTANNTSGAFASDPFANVSITSPAGGEQLLSNAVTPITWSITGSVNNAIAIDYQLSGQSSWTSIVSGTPNDGTHPWTIPSVASNTSARVRVTATASTCGGPAVTNVGGYFAIVPTTDDGNACTADLLDAPNSQVVHPATCPQCDINNSCSPPFPFWWECHNGHCEPPWQTCTVRPCHIAYKDASGNCREINVCGEHECCVDGQCVPDNGQPCLNPDLVQKISLSMLDHGLGQVIDLAQGVLHLTTASPGFAYGMYDLPANAAFLSFEYQLNNPGGDELLSVSFGSSGLMLTSTPTPTSQWENAMLYVSDLAGQRDALTFALLPGSAPTPDDELLVRNIQVFGPGTPVCFTAFNGDGDGSGTTDGADIQNFVNAMLLSSAYESNCAYDMNADGSIDTDDIAPFVTRLLLP